MDFLGVVLVFKLLEVYMDKYILIDIISIFNRYLHEFYRLKFPMHLKFSMHLKILMDLKKI